jgi:HPr kinase/phosphorylase
MVFGAPADILRHHVEVRGLGVLNIKDLFGVTAVRDRKRIDVVVQLDEWDETREYDRLGVDDRHFNILSTAVRLVTVPVRPGRDMGAMLEMAARNELLRRAGKHSARELLARLEENAGLTPEVAIDDQPESVINAPFGPQPYASSPLPPPPNSSIARPDPAWRDDRDSDRPVSPGPPRPAYDRSSGESSAWIPAVRPKGNE